MKRAYFQTKLIAIKFTESIRKVNHGAVVGVYGTGYMVSWLP